MIFTARVLDHNHPVSEEHYNNYPEVKRKKIVQNEEAVKTVQLLEKAHADTYHQVEVINEEYNTKLTTKDLTNYKKH